MFSSEMWYNPDLPVGSNLWSSTTTKMEAFIRKCNELGQTAGNKCNATLSDFQVDQATVDDESRLAPSLVDYLPTDVEPNYLVPKDSKVGELYNLFYRNVGEPLKNDEAFGIALPPELLQEFQTYIDKNGMLDHARRLIYEEEPFGNNEHRLYKLNDGMTWGCKYLKTKEILIEYENEFSWIRQLTWISSSIMRRYGPALGRYGYGVD